MHHLKKHEPILNLHAHSNLFLLTRACEDLGTEETGCWNFWRGTLSHSCLILDSNGSTVLGRLSYFSFHDTPNVFKAGRPAQHLALLLCCFNGYIMFSCWNVQKYVRLFLTTTSSASVPLKSVCCMPFSIDGAFADVQADNSIGTNAPPYHQMVLLSLKRISNIDLSDHRTQFSTLRQTILNELWPRQGNRISGSCLHLASSFFFNLHLWMTPWTKAFLRLYSDFLDSLGLFSVHWHQRA